MIHPASVRTFVRMGRRPQIDFKEVRILIGEGLGDSEIARLTGIPRSTISAWRHGRGSRFHERLASADSSWRPSDGAAYCYLLGAYLGDGCLHVTPGGAAGLIVSLDGGYPAVVAEVERAVARTFPGVGTWRSAVPGSRVAIVHASHPALPFAFPQHGPGRKHLRRIELVAWQRSLTREHPRQLLRGMIHSDGCRTINRFRTTLPSGRVAEYEYPRYFFSNLSADIRRIFCEHCELLGIRWTQSNARNISVSDRRSVGLLDDFVGPKR
jgi:hypothetical protein